MNYYTPHACKQRFQIFPVIHAPKSDPDPAPNWDFPFILSPASQGNHYFSSIPCLKPYSLTSWGKHRWKVVSINTLTTLVRSLLRGGSGAPTCSSYKSLHTGRVGNWICYLWWTKINTNGTGYKTLDILKSDFGPASSCCFIIVGKAPQRQPTGFSKFPTMLLKFTSCLT